jgi:hypothetical protein
MPAITGVTTYQHSRDASKSRDASNCRDASKHYGYQLFRNNNRNTMATVTMPAKAEKFANEGT